VTKRETSLTPSICRKTSSRAFRAAPQARMGKRPRAERPALLFRDYDALAADPRRVAADKDERAVNHVDKRKQRTKGSEVVFDPAKHKCVARAPAACGPHGAA
jgi:hypothetical protein